MKLYTQDEYEALNENVYTDGKGHYSESPKDGYHKISDMSYKTFDEQCKGKTPREKSVYINDKANEKIGELNKYNKYYTYSNQWEPSEIEKDPEKQVIVDKNNARIDMIKKIKDAQFSQPETHTKPATEEEKKYIARRQEQYRQDDLQQRTKDAPTVGDDWLAAEKQHNKDKQKEHIQGIGKNIVSGIQKMSQRLGDNVRSIFKPKNKNESANILDTAMTLVEAGEIESAQILLTRLNESDDQ